MVDICPNCHHSGFRQGWDGSKTRNEAIIKVIDTRNGTLKCTDCGKVFGGSK